MVMRPLATVGGADAGVGGGQVLADLGDGHVVGDAEVLPLDERDLGGQGCLRLGVGGVERDGGADRGRGVGLRSASGVVRSSVLTVMLLS